MRLTARLRIEHRVFRKLLDLMEIALTLPKASILQTHYGPRFCSKFSNCRQRQLVDNLVTALLWVRLSPGRRFFQTGKSRPAPALGYSPPSAKISNLRAALWNSYLPLVSFSET